MVVRRWLGVFCLALAMGAVAPLWAQFTTASLGGRVRDASGGVVAGATVHLRNLGTGQVLATKSSAAGHYLFPALPVGTYALTVSKSGFQTFVQTGIELSVNQAATVPVQLRL
ncbi:MAG: carboxypeptidase-like regulatory domain-containing protein, partial [Terriglobales bacterium]